MIILIDLKHNPVHIYLEKSCTGFKKAKICMNYSQIWTTFVTNLIQKKEEMFGSMRSASSEMKCTYVLQFCSSFFIFSIISPILRFRPTGGPCFSSFLFIFLVISLLFLFLSFFRWRLKTFVGFIFSREFKTGGWIAYKTDKITFSMIFLYLLENRKI